MAEVGRELALYPEKKLMDNGTSGGLKSRNNRRAARITTTRRR